LRLIGGMPMSGVLHRESTPDYGLLLVIIGGLDFA
jgi:hypothetical protein